MDLTLTWIAGPDAGGCTTIGPGRWVIGRRGDVSCDDPALLPLHAAVDVPDGGGTARLTPLGGRQPIRIDDDECHGSVGLRTGAHVDLGRSRLHVAVVGATPRSAVASTSSTAPPQCADIRRDVVHRAPRSPTAPPDDPATLAWSDADLAPPVRERPGGLAPAAAGVGGAAVLAVVMRQPTFVVFGLVGAAIAVTSWCTQHVTFARRHREAIARHDDERDRRHLQHLLADRVRTIQQWRATPGLAEAIDTVSRPSAALWARRPLHGDAHIVSAGLRVTANGAAVAVVPCAIELGTACRIALIGPDATATTRSLLIQAMAQCGPADLRIALVTDTPSRWRWLWAAPHLLRVGDESRSLLAEVAEFRRVAPASHVVVLCDDESALADRASAVRRLCEHDATVGLIAVGSTAPHICVSRLVTDGTAIGHWHTAGDVIDVRLAGLGEEAAERATRQLSRWRDPEDPTTTPRTAPSSVDLREIVPVLASPTLIAATWTNATDENLATPVGRDVEGAVVEIDFTRDGPHMLIGGTTGSGKSELLRTMVLGLAARHHPARLTFVLVDYKGGAAFDACARLPHVGAVVTDLDDGLADRMLGSLRAELRRREVALRRDGVADLAARYRCRADGSHLARLVVVVDEFAALVDEQPEFLRSLIAAAQRGRSLGVHLVLATQRPTGVINDDIKANTSLRLALRMHDAADAVDVVGDASPTSIPRRLPGRAVLRLGGDAAREVQVARAGHLDDDVTTIELAATLVGGRSARAPWCDPLPRTLARSDLGRRLAQSLEAGEDAAPPGPPVDGPAGESVHGTDHPAVVGLLDDPDRQRAVTLRYRRTDGPLLVVGSSGSGVTAALGLVVDAAIAEGEAVYVIDAGGDPRWDRRRCLGGIEVVRPDDDGRLIRLEDRLIRPVARDEPTTIVIDGFDVLRRRLDHPCDDHRPEYRHLTAGERVVDVVLRAADSGAQLVIGTAPCALAPALLDRLTRRWVLHIGATDDAVHLGHGPGTAPPPVPGRVRVDGLLGQLLDPRTCDAVAARRRVPAIERVPEVVQTDDLPAGRDDDGCHLPLGIDVVTGDIVWTTLRGGEHLLVLGAPEEARAMVLGHVARRVDRCAGPPDVVVIDDADRIDDRDGALSDMADDPDVVVIAAARGDALRVRHGHWTVALRRSRSGMVLLGGDTQADGELLGVVLPRRFPVRPRRGAAWWVDHGTVRPVLLACAAPTALRGGGRPGAVGR